MKRFLLSFFLSLFLPVSGGGASWTVSGINHLKHLSKQTKKHELYAADHIGIQHP
jgi:hypothetical protein